MLLSFLAALAIASPWLTDDEASRQFDLASKAARAGDHVQADRLLRSVWLHPDWRARAAQRLEGLDLALEIDAEKLDTLRTRLGSGFRPTETEHFLILCDGTTRWARSTGDTLERTYDQFERFAERLDMPLVPPRSKMVCVLFQSFDDYRTFAAREDGIAAPWVAGYYASGPDRLVLYNEESSPAAREAGASLDDLTGRIDDARRDARTANADQA
ncbi:MAG: hypothetical protein KDA28_05050, partial [Phycisphaerales bacterium]|nr:hypothetical protein [Phycisphaerales bacterium]